MVDVCVHVGSAVYRRGGGGEEHTHRYRRLGIVESWVISCRLSPGGGRRSDARAVLHHSSE